MRKLLLLASLFVCTVMMAGQVDQETAKQKAMAFASVKMGVKAQKSMRAANSGVRKASNRAAERDYLHVFNIDGGGYVIVSGDDRTEEILGYSLTGTFDANKIPDNMRAFLQEYVDAIQYLDDHHIQVRKPANRANRVTKASISPLLKSTWDQWAPYNLYCPEISKNKRAVSGCVATAMAQVLYYYKKPSMTVKEIPEYTTGSLKIKMPAIEKTTINWDYMKDGYTCYDDKDKTVDNATLEEKAVGKLMLLCGQSLEMDYNTSSGAYASDCVHALGEYFDYDKSTLKSLSRANYNYGKWQEIIYNELASNRPVIYSGQSAGGGHAFVCDGYDKDDFFHINWGWSGGADNYFRLCLLNPSEQGAGGSTTNEGFGLEQAAVIGIQPSDGINIKAISLSLYKLVMNQSTVTRTSSNEDFILNQMLEYALINSGNGGTYKFDIGIRIVNASNNTVMEQAITGADGFELKDDYFASIDYLPPFGKNQPNGVYRLYVISRKTGSTKWKICDGMEEDPILLTISGNTLTITPPEMVVGPVEDLAVTSKVEGKLEVGAEQTITVTVKNNSTLSFRDNIYYKVNGGKDLVPAAFLEVEGGGTSEFSFKFTPVEEGTNTLRLVSDRTGEYIGDPIEIIIGAPTPTAKLEITDITTNMKFDGESYYVEDDEFTIDIQWKNNGAADYEGEFITYYYCHVPAENKWYFVKDTEFTPFTLAVGEEKTISCKLTNPHWDDCDLYCLGFGYTKKDDDDAYYEAPEFEFRSGNAIGVIKAAPKVQDGTIYDLNGRRIDASNLESLKPGMYIINGKKVIKKR